MNKIFYRYTNLPKQALLLSILTYFVLRAVIMTQIVIYRLEGYYENVNIPLTILMYAVIFAFLIFLMRCYKFFYALYDNEEITYYNRILRTARSFSLSRAQLAYMGTFGIKFFDSVNVDPKKDKPLFFIPFFRFGIIEALSINKFYMMLRDRENFHIIKTFKVLPGYTHKWKFLSVAYAFAAALMFMSCSTPLTVIIVLFQNH